MDLFIFALIVPILIIIVLLWSCVRARLRHTAQPASDQAHAAEYGNGLHVYEDEVPGGTLFYYQYYPRADWSVTQTGGGTQGGLYGPTNTTIATTTNTNTGASNGTGQGTGGPLILPATVIATGTLPGLGRNGAGENPFPQVQPRPLYGAGLYPPGAPPASSPSSTTGGNYYYAAGDTNTNSCHEVDENGNALPDASEVYGTATYLPRPPEKKAAASAKGKWEKGDAKSL